MECPEKEFWYKRRRNCSQLDQYPSRAGKEKGKRAVSAKRSTRQWVLHRLCHPPGHPEETPDRSLPALQTSRGRTRPARGRQEPSRLLGPGETPHQDEPGGC